jgi:hypothetical protein
VLGTDISGSGYFAVGGLNVVNMKGAAAVTARQRGTRTLSAKLFVQELDGEPIHNQISGVKAEAFVLPTFVPSHAIPRAERPNPKANC